MSDKDFKVKNKLVVNGLTGGAGPLVANSNKEIDSVAFLTTLQGGTGTTTSPSSGQVLYSAGGTTYNPTTLNTLDVKGATYSADAPSSPVVGQIWVESDVDSDSFDPNIIRRKTFTATAAQTVFTTDVPFIQGYEQVFFNGMLLIRNSDYTTANDTNVTLAAGAAAGDIVEVVSITNLNSINTATTTTNTFTGNQTFNGSLNFTSANSTINFSDALFIQKTGTGARIRIDSDGKVGISGNTPQASFDIGERSGDTKTAILARMAGDHGFQLSAFNGSATNLSGNLAAKIGIHYHGVGDNAMIKFYRGGSAVDGTVSIETNQVERMRIDSAGKVGIGMTPNTEPYPLQVAGRIRVGSGNQDAEISWRNRNNTNVGWVIGIRDDVGGANNDFKLLRLDDANNYAGIPMQVTKADGYLLVGYSSSNGAYRLQVNSQIFATSSSIATSDGRYKENVNTITSGLDIVDSLRPVSFTWKDHPVHNFVAGKTVGFIAQEVQESLSEYDWVDNIIKSNYNEETEEEFLGIAESNIIPLLVAAVKELKARVETLEANNV